MIISGGMQWMSSSYNRARTSSNLNNYHILNAGFTLQIGLRWHWWGDTPTYCRGDCSLIIISAVSRVYISQSGFEISWSALNGYLRQGKQMELKRRKRKRILACDEDHSHCWTLQASQVRRARRKLRSHFWAIRVASCVGRLRPSLRQVFDKTSAIFKEQWKIFLKEVETEVWRKEILLAAKERRLECRDIDCGWQEWPCSLSCSTGWGDTWHCTSPSFDEVRAERPSSDGPLQWSTQLQSFKFYQH